MAITVGELIAIPHLGTTLCAGADGLNRLVTWAHSCEVPNPWNWLDEGDLLMTNGYSLPPDAEGQVAFVEHLARAGISAIAIGAEQHAPPLTPEVIEAADRLGLPILSSAYEVPFVAVARAVAAANQREEQARLSQAERLYDRLREMTAAGAGSRELLDRLGDDLRSRLHIVDLQRAVEMLPASPALPDAIVTELAERTSQFPALYRMTVGAATALVVPIPSRREALLVTVPQGASRPDLAVLQHAATIAALQVERLTAERQEQRRLGAELLADLVNGRVEGGSAQHQLEVRGLGGRPIVLVACSDGGGACAPTLHCGLADRGVAHLLLPHLDTLLVALPDEPDALGVLRDETGPDVRFGVSDPVHGAVRVPDAVREARWALQAAESDGADLMHYGENAPLFMPRTLGEVESAVRRVLGPLLDYDAEHGTQLLLSLRVFLECNRSWQRASKQLFVHKQTLVYRMRRVEELTGRRLDDTAAVAELWLALRAHDLGEDPALAAEAPGPATPV